MDQSKSADKDDHAGSRSRSRSRDKQNTPPPLAKTRNGRSKEGRSRRVTSALDDAGNQVCS